MHYLPTVYHDSRGYRTIVNLNKIGVKTKTLAMLRNRFNILEKNWAKVNELYVEIETSVRVEEKFDIIYYTDEAFSKAEKAYLEAADYRSEEIVTL